MERLSTVVAHMTKKNPRSMQGAAGRLQEGVVVDVTKPPVRSFGQLVVLSSEYIVPKVRWLRWRRGASAPEGVKLMEIATEAEMGELEEKANAVVEETEQMIEKLKVRVRSADAAIGNFKAKDKAAKEMLKKADALLSAKPV